MENSIATKLNRPEAVARTIVAGPTASTSHGAHDLFEQFLTRPSSERSDQRPEPQKSASDIESREDSTKDSRERRIHDEKDVRTEPSVETDGPQRSSDPLLAPGSEAEKEPSIVATERSTDAIEEAVGDVDVHGASVEQTVTETNANVEQIDVGFASQAQAVSDRGSAIDSKQEPIAVAPEQAIDNNLARAEKSQSQSAADAATATGRVEPQSNQLAADSQGELTRAGESQENTSTAQFAKDDDRDEAHEQEPASLNVNSIDSTEDETTEVKWFQQPAASPLYGGAHQSAPQSLPPVDSNLQGANAGSEPHDELSLAPAPTTDASPSEGNNDATVAEADVTTASNSNPSDGSPTSTAITKPQAVSPIASSDSNSTVGTQTTNNSSARPDTGGQVRSVNHGDAPGAPTAETGDISQHERVRLIQRVSRSFSRLTPTGGEINLRLHPPQLGSLAVKVQMEGNTLSARLSTESEAAREIIMESLPVLRKRLADQGIEVTQMHVDVSDSSSDMSMAGSNDQGPHDQQAESGAQRRVAQFRQAVAGRQLPSAAAATVTTATVSSQTWSAATSIDVHA